jgi:hypothetical protein
LAHAELNVRKDTSDRVEGTHDEEFVFWESALLWSDEVSEKHSPQHDAAKDGNVHQSGELSEEVRIVLHAAQCKK